MEGAPLEMYKCLRLHVFSCMTTLRERMISTREFFLHTYITSRTTIDIKPFPPIEIILILRRKAYVDFAGHIYVFEVIARLLRERI